MTQGCRDFQGRGEVQAMGLAFTSRCVYLETSSPVDKSGRSSPVVVSLLPRCQGLYGSAKTIRTASPSTKVLTVEPLRAPLRRSPSRCRVYGAGGHLGGDSASAACEGSGCVGLFPATGRHVAWQHRTPLTVLGGGSKIAPSFGANGPA